MRRQRQPPEPWRPDGQPAGQQQAAADLRHRISSPPLVLSAHPPTTAHRGTAGRGRRSASARWSGACSTSNGGETVQPFRARCSSGRPGSVRALAFTPLVRRQRPVSSASTAPAELTDLPRIGTVLELDPAGFRRGQSRRPRPARTYPDPRGQPGSMGAVALAGRRPATCRACAEQEAGGRAEVGSMSFTAPTTQRGLVQPRDARAVRFHHGARGWRLRSHQVGPDAAFLARPSSTSTPRIGAWACLPADPDPGVLSWPPAYLQVDMDALDHHLVGPASLAVDEVLRARRRR